MIVARTMASATTRVVGLAAAFASLVGCAAETSDTPSTNQSSTTAAGALTLALAAEIPDLRSKAEVSWQITLTNSGKKPVTLTFNSGLDADVELLDANDDVVYRWSDGRSFTQAIRHRFIAAGARLRFTLTGILDVAPGHYTARVVLAARPAPLPITRGVDVAA